MKAAPVAIAAAVWSGPSSGEHEGTTKPRRRRAEAKQRLQRLWRHIRLSSQRRREALSSSETGSPHPGYASAPLEDKSRVSDTLRCTERFGACSTRLLKGVTHLGHLDGVYRSPPIHHRKK